jgi:ABC-2 type transport system ATP-binding protein
MKGAFDPDSGVVVKDLTKVYQPSPGWMKMMARSYIKDDVIALDGISFEVQPGEICAIVGPNGAGKTTTFRILVGLTTATTGTATVMGLDCDRESRQVRHVLGWMPADDRSLVMRLSCAENLHFHGRLQGLKGEDLKERIRETLRLVGLAHVAESSVFALSAGMKARLQLARALLTRPRVLILDEPTGSVDPVASHELLNLIIDLVEDQELAALISSHRLEEIEALHSHAVLLDKGQIRFDGDLDALRGELDRPTLEMRFRSPAAASRVKDLLTQNRMGDVVNHEDRVLQLVLDQGMVAGNVLASLGTHLDELETVTERQTPLRDLLAQMYRKEDNR